MQVLLDNYVAVLLATVIGFMLVGSAILGSRLLAPNSQSENKKTSYECGMIPAAAPVRSQIHIRYYLFAILFLIFDVEAVFLFPWAVNLDTFAEAGQGALIYFEMLAFVVILILGLVYAIRKGVLRWE